MNYINLEYHPADSRIRIVKEDVCQTLSTRMDTGGGNVPLVIFVKSRRAKDRSDFETWKQNDVACTLNAFESGDKRSTTLIVYGCVRNDNKR